MVRETASPLNSREIRIRKRHSARFGAKPPKSHRYRTTTVVLGLENNFGHDFALLLLYHFTLILESCDAFPRSQSCSKTVHRYCSISGLTILHAETWQKNQAYVIRRDAHQLAGCQFSRVHGISGHIQVHIFKRAILFHILSGFKDFKIFSDLMNAG